MKEYRANNCLIKVLKNQGFIETTADRDKEKGKKKFSVDKKTKKGFFFDYENIFVFYNLALMDDRYVINEKELKLALFYLSLSPKELRYVYPSITFSYEKFDEAIKFLYAEKEQYEDSNINNAKYTKTIKLINKYNSIVF